MELDWRIARAAGTTFVSLTLSNPGPVDRQVRVANELDGDPLPPRVDGVPIAGWTDAVFETVVPGDDTVAVGYACEAPAAEPPASVVDTAVVDDEEEQPAAADAARDLGSHRPPRAAMPSMLDTRLAAADTGPTLQSPAGEGPPGDRSTAENPSEAAKSAPRSADSGTTPPPPVATWLETATVRIRRAERLDGASLEEATGELADLGGISGARELQTALAADERRLRAVASRASALADRAAETTVPVDSLGELS